MRIGLFLSTLPVYSETFILSKIHGLKKDGHEVIVYLANRSKASTDYQYVNPYPRSVLWTALIFPILLVFLTLSKTSVLLKFWRRETSSGKGILSVMKSIYINAHVLQARRLNWLHFGFATFSIGRENVASSIGARMAVSLRGFDIGIYPLKKPGCYDLLWQVVDKVHTISDDLYHLALENGLSPSVSVQKIRPAFQTDKIRIKSDPGAIKSPCSIVSVGRLEWKKGFLYALEAMRILKQQDVKFKYTIIGEGLMDEEIRFAIYDLGLAGCVSLTGKLPHEKIFEVLQNADIYIQPSVQEGFCNSLIEAQGTGLLCIASDAEGLTENVLHGQTGWIVQKRQPHQLAETILHALAMSEEERKAIAENAVKRVRNEFDISRLVKEFGEFYTNS